MAKPLADANTLKETLQKSGGLTQFRTVADAPRRIVRDSPFGQSTTTPEPVKPSAAPATNGVAHEMLPTPPPPTRPHSKKTPSRTDEPGEAVADQFPEKLTVPLSLALSDRSGELAKCLNRSRTVRKERITRNSIIRVALHCFLDQFDLPAGQAVNSEQELLQLAQSRLRR